jgi:hypothetical protein
MATQRDVRRIALSLPEAIEDLDGFSFSVRRGSKQRGFAWVWMERVDPKRPKQPNPGVLAVRTADVMEKEALIASEPEVFFTEPHYNGFPAVLIRLDAIDVDELREVLTDGWRTQAPTALRRAFDEA